MPPLPKTDKIAPSRPPRQQRPASASSMASLKLSTSSNANGNGNGISNGNNGSTMSAAVSPPTPTGSVRLSMQPLSPTEVTNIGVTRPNPPRIRAKRVATASTPRGSPVVRTKALAETGRREDLPSSSSRASFERERYTGSIVEGTEEELGAASREALQNALRKEWFDREQMAARIEEQDRACRRAEDRAAETQSAHESLQAKFDALYNEQNVLDAELEAANELVERLRSNLAESERQTRQGHRRYADQEKAFEAERLVHQAEQSHLQQRIKSLMTERVARPGNDESNAALQEELVTLTASHQTLVQQLTTLADEMHELKADNARLQEENESWQLLIEDRTLAGAMRGGLLSPANERGPSPSSASNTMRRTDSSVLETLEEQMEMDELNNEMDAHQSYFDEMPDQGLRASPTKPNGLSLALELSAAPQMAEMEALRAETKALKEANRALSLYCSKILDRIMASDGYEHILASDYRTRRGLRGASGGKARPSVEEMAKAMEQNGPPPVPEDVLEAPPALTPAPVPAPSAPLPKARPQSMMVVSNAQQPLPKPSEMKKDADKEKRARRGFSIDFRSLGFGASEPKPEPKSHLKPLQLASRAAPAHSASGTSSPPKQNVAPAAAPASAPVSTPSAAIIARKLEPQEEDEEDRRERHHMEAALKLMGIDRSTPPTESAPLPAVIPEPPNSSTGNWFSRRLSRAAAGPAKTPPEADADRSSTPLGRLSVALGGEADNVLAGLADLTDEPSDTPEIAAAALRAYDEREREQARLLSEGKSQTAFTSPPKLSRDRRSRPSSTSTTSTRSTGPIPTGHRKVDSVSTLFSMDSSRASGDYERDHASLNELANERRNSVTKVMRVSWNENEDGVTKRHTRTTVVHT